MHAVQPAPVPEALAAKLQRLQADALETVHWVMLHLAKSLTTPQEAERADPITTQRARLCLQAARDLLRFRPPAPATEPTDDHASPPSPAQRERVAHAPRGRVRVSCDALRSEAEPEANPAEHRSASMSVSGRIDSPLTPDASSLTPPRDSSPIAHTAPRPPRPQFFTQTEAREIIAVMQTKADRLKPHQYARILEWNAYAIPAGLSTSFGITADRLEARKPLDPSAAPEPPSS